MANDEITCPECGCYIHLEWKKSDKKNFNKILYMKFGEINLKRATWSSLFQEKIKKYKFKKNDAVILHISIPEDNIVRMVNIEPITQKGIRQVIKEAEEYEPIEVLKR